VKNGQTPIHIQRWAPADYHADEHVKLLKARRDYRTLTFYRHFLDHSHSNGGDLPADPELLAAVLEMPRRDVVKALEFCLERLIFRDGDRLYQPRVRRDVLAELQFREEQRLRGEKGNIARWGGSSQSGSPSRSQPRSQSGSRKDRPPSPAPAPTPSPAPYAVGEAVERVPSKRSIPAIEAALDRLSSRS
jgi:hypothetical protein